MDKQNVIASCLHGRWMQKKSDKKLMNTEERWLNRFILRSEDKTETIIKGAFA